MYIHILNKHLKLENMKWLGQMLHAYKHYFFCFYQLEWRKVEPHYTHGNGQLREAGSSWPRALCLAGTPSIILDVAALTAKFTYL